MLRVKIEWASRAEELERKINEFLEGQSFTIVDIKVTGSESEYIAVILYEI